MEQAFLQLKDIKRYYQTGEEQVCVLKGINLTINRGEKVAIIGASGSGKSTLMNILGCLDKASSGEYKIDGRDTKYLDSDELSALRREYFGFIFQRYHLLNALTAVANVEIPAIYAGVSSSERFEAAKKLLFRLGLGDRLYHKPNELSGGQQQRVSIARALINGCELILADEPTGALDSQSGEEVLKILDELHQDGRTIVIVTHDAKVAQRAQRIIEIKDGSIIADYYNKPRLAEADFGGDSSHKDIYSSGKLGYSEAGHSAGNYQPGADEFGLVGKKSKTAFSLQTLKESFMMAVYAMKANPLRSFLTMLGIIIGIAAVILLVAMGNGTQEKIMSNINSMGTNKLTIFAGKSLSDRHSGLITTLKDSDANALKQLPFVVGVSPAVAGSGTVSYGDIVASANIRGESEQVFLTQRKELVYGRFFTAQDVARRDMSIVIEEQGAEAIFGHSGADIIGKIVFVSGEPARIVGIIKDPPSGITAKNVLIYAPYKAVQTRLLGSDKIGFITVRIADNVNDQIAEQAVSKILQVRHGAKDFFIINSEVFRKKVQQSMSMLTLLVAAIASISLLVGGIGVMNIMLVSVSERVGEIGVRMAVGARKRDISLQFFIETVIICLSGGIIGILLGISLGEFISAMFSSVHVCFSMAAILGSFIFSCLIGFCFGILPARRASNLDPVVALVGE